MKRALYIAATAALLLTGCRSLARNALNTDMEGKPAPTLQSHSWLLPEGEAPPSEQWTVLAFFLPT